MIVKFVNRDYEFSLLNNAYKNTKPQLVIVYGRRRVGKTRFLTEFLKDKDGLYFYVPLGGEEAVLEEFSKAVENEFFKGFKFNNFRSFLEYVSRKFDEGKIVVIDEFQRLSEINGAISLIQKYWDENFSKKKSMLILAGSSVGLIRRIALKGDAPLYGRRTLSLEIKPLEFEYIKDWFSKYNKEDLVKIYAAFGGTPAYLEKINEEETVEKNIIELILRKNGPLHDEPEFLLLEEVRVPYRYLDILTAISHGKCYLSEIADFTRIRRENLTTYLSILENLGIIKREVPVLNEKKRSRYLITDPFFNFWFKFVKPNKTILELGLEEMVWQQIREDFNAYVGSIFEEICKQFVVKEISKGNIDLKANIIGRWIYKGEEIDLITYSSKDRKGILFEIKWKVLSYEETKSIILKLIEKSSMVKIEDKKFGLIGKKVFDKEKLRNEGYFVFDLDDILT